MTTPTGDRSTLPLIGAGPIEVLDQQLAQKALARQEAYEAKDPKTPAEARIFVEGIKDFYDDYLKGPHGAEFKQLYESEFGKPYARDDQESLSKAITLYSKVCDLTSPGKTHRIFWSGGFDLSSVDSNGDKIFPWHTGGPKKLGSRFIAEAYAEMAPSCVTLELTEGAGQLDSFHLYNKHVAAEVFGSAGLDKTGQIFGDLSARYAQITSEMIYSGEGGEVLVFNSSPNRKTIWEREEQGNLPYQRCAYVFHPNADGISYQKGRLLDMYDIPKEKQEEISEEIISSNIFGAGVSITNPLSPAYFDLRRYGSLDFGERQEVLIKTLQSAHAAGDDAKVFDTMFKKFSAQFNLPGCPALGKLQGGFNVDGRTFEVREPFDWRAMQQALETVKTAIGEESRHSRVIPGGPTGAPSMVVSASSEIRNPFTLRVPADLAKGIARSATNQEEVRNRIDSAIEERKDVIEALTGIVGRVQGRMIDYINQITPEKINDHELPPEAVSARTRAGNDAQLAYKSMGEFSSTLKMFEKGLPGYQAELSKMVTDIKLQNMGPAAAQMTSSSRRSSIFETHVKNQRQPPKNDCAIS